MFWWVIERWFEKVKNAVQVVTLLVELFQWQAAADRMLRRLSPSFWALAHLHAWLQPDQSDLLVPRWVVAVDLLAVDAACMQQWFSIWHKLNWVFAGHSRPVNRLERVWRRSLIVSIVVTRSRIVVHYLHDDFVMINARLEVYRWSNLPCLGPHRTLSDCESEAQISQLKDYGIIMQ